MTSIIPTNFITRAWLKDSAERVFWTAAQVAVATVAVKLTELPSSTVLLIAPALAAVKAFVAKKVGNPADASTRRS